MTNSELITKKRKRLLLPANDGHSLTGIFTRSKSLIHLHLNRSGQSRTDSTWEKMHQNVKALSRKRKASSSSQYSSMGRDLSAGSIKDLRSRRVFSPFSENGVIHNGLDEIEKLEKIEPSGDFGDLGMSNEGNVQSTPPDPEIFGSGNGSGLLDQVLEKKTNENLQKLDGCTEKSFEERDGTNSSIKPILKPCSRVKLFKTPDAPVVSNCQKSERGLEEEQTLDSKSQEKVADSSVINGSMEANNNGCCNRLKRQLQVSCEVQNLNSPKLNSSPTIVDSCSNKGKLADAICSDQMTKYDDKFAESSGPSPCSAQSPELLDQKLLTATNKSESRDYVNIRQNSDDKEQKTETEGMPIATAVHSFEAQKMHSPNSVLSEMKGYTKRCLQQRVGNDGEVLEQVEGINTPLGAELCSRAEAGDSIERMDCVSQGIEQGIEKSINETLGRNNGQGGEVLEQVEGINTPLGADLCSRAEAGDSIERMDCVSKGIEQGIEKSKNETLGRNNGQGGDKSLGSSPENKSVSNPRLQRLSRIINSYHCRRLLPFLKEITKEYSCASRNDPSPKVEKSSEEKPLSPLVTSGKEMCMETVSDKACPVGIYNVDESLVSIAATAATRCSSHKQVADSPMFMDSQQDQESPLVHSALDTIQKLENSPGNYVEPSAMSSTSLTNPGLLPGEEGANLVSHPPEEVCIKSTLKCAGTEKQTEAYNPPGIPVAVVKKGILKRNPRGCRGVCTCLNCSSFRLHAERSFEFSRNQMQDAEEVALDLIKELSWLRNMLEKSSFDAKDESSIYINQVKEACKKASVAEELARSRLREMNYELNIHCQTPCEQRPSVRFANGVEEQINK